MSDIPWVIKYNPQTIDNMVLTEQLKTLFHGWIQNKTLNNITLHGLPGCGKTTIAKLIAKQLKCNNVLFQSCSIDGSIDMVKTKIKDFCDIYVGDEIKIIILDEADSLTATAGSNAGAQMALRNIIAQSMQNTRFILTCNYIDRVIPALQSRCTPIKLEFTIQDVIKHILYILKSQNITVSKQNLKTFIDTTVKRRFPDIRSIIQHLQLSSQTGELLNLQSTTELLNDQLISFITTCNDPMQIREFLHNNQQKFSSDYIQLASKLFNYYTTNAEVMLLIAEYIYKMTSVLDKQIQFTSMIIQLKNMENKK